MTGNGANTLAAFVSGGLVSDTVVHQILEALPVAIYVTDAQGRLTYFNSAAAKLSGLRPEIGTDKWCATWKIFLSDGTPLSHDQSAIAVALTRGDVPTGIECMAERPDGTRFWFTPTATVLRDGAGRIIGGLSLLLDITERKNAEMEAKEQFRAIVDATPECVKIVAADGTLLFMNPPGLTMIGAPSIEAVIGQNIYDVIAPEDRERFRTLNEMVCRGKKASLQFDIVGLKGERRHLETHAAPLRHIDGTTVQLAVTHDVTERKRAEGAALLLSAIVESSDDAIISKDLDGFIMSWNNSAQRLFGFTAQEAIGHTVASLLIPEDRQEEEPKILARLRRGERVDHFETVRRRKDGSLIDISLTISPVKDAQGGIIGASKIARDISESKHIQAALMESEARFRQLADTMPQMVWTARPDGIVDYWNERWFRFTGFTPVPLKDASSERILHPDDLPRAREAWYTAVHSGEAYNIEFRFWDRQENRWRWFVARAVPIRDAAGNIVRWFGTYTDIDEQKRVQDELRRVNEDLEQFAFSASHDLQEPLRTIKIYSELLTRRHAAKLDGDALKFLHFLRKGATRMETLVRDLLTYTQVTRFDAHVGVADANEALKAALENLSGAIADTGAEIIIGPLPSVGANNTHLEQLFQNLIGNAIKYRSPERRPSVKIAAELQDGQWLFSVRDNGIGIESAYKENIFGLFKRLHNSDEYSGSGIGLAICQRLVDRYHGRIWVESEPGQGSTFFFTIPL
jgi:PAS domain S-box-containing protein